MTIYNTSNTTNFLLDIPDAGITEAFKLNVQTALIPGIRIPVTNAPTGTQGLGRANLPGSTFEFDPLVVRFLLDEDLDSWLQLYEWMLSINNYLTLKSDAWNSGQVPEFITLHVLDNTKTKPVISFHYYGAWCSELSDIEYNYSEDGNPPMTSTATFFYKFVKIEKNGKIIETRRSRDDILAEKQESFNRIAGQHPRYRQN